MYWLPHDTAKTGVLKQGEGRHNYSILLFESHHPLWPPAFSSLSPNGGRSLASGMRFTVWNIARCIWNGRVETEVMSRFNRAVFWRTIRLKPVSNGSLQPIGRNGSCISVFTARPNRPPPPPHPRPHPHPHSQPCSTGSPAGMSR